MNRQVSEGTYFQESVIQSAQNHIFATTMPRGGRVPIEHNEALQLVQNCSAFSYDSSVERFFCGLGNDLSAIVQV
jgi:hypothetical protein